MWFVRIRVIAMLVAGTVVTGYAYQGAPPWARGVQKMPDESPALSPADALKTFAMPPGYRLELVASEPTIQDPVALDWDARGRLWAVEMPGFVPDLDTPEPNLAPIGRIVVLEDTNADGTMDKRTVFADGLVMARALKVLDDGVLVGEPPNVWRMRDTNGDLRMDTKELVTDTYGRRDGNVEGNANSFFWALDNRMHTAGQTDSYLRFKDGRIDVQKTLARGEWGATQDDAGRIYRNTNESALHVDLVPTPYFARHPNLLRTRGSYEPLDDDDVNAVWPIRPTPGTNRAYQLGVDRPDGTLARFTSVCAPLVYRGDRLPAELYGNVFVAEPAANLVSRLIVEDDGTTLRARKAYQGAEFLASTDERFRPVFLSNAPDGTLYIADMYRGIIQQRISITTYLREQILARKLVGPTGLGRIYRVVHETTRRDTSPGLAQASPAQLVDALSHPNGWRRDMAQQLLVQRAARGMADTLTRLATTAKDPRTRLHAMWTLDGVDRIEPATVTKALADPSRDVRVAAIRIAERWLGEPDHPIQAAVLERLQDNDWAVRQQLAASLGVMPPASRERAAVTLLERYADDPVVVDAALSGLRGSEAAVLESLLQRSAAAGDLGPAADTTGATRPAPGAAATGPAGPRAPRETAITMLSALIVRSAQESTVQRLFEWTSDGTRGASDRAAILRGAEIALLGAAMPGTAPRRNVTPLPTPPCPTCPGARAGPGGDSAFPSTGARGGAAAVAAGRGGRGGRGGGPGLRLNREPAALAALAAQGGDLGPRAAGLLARIEWPGKPGATAPLAPLSPDEQQRFDNGREIYKSICQACHQPDGRGQEKVAATLIGSGLALGPPGIPVRILLNGKEGPVGLMPPIGQSFTDDQVAAVLTYIRREWGQTGAPVDADTVKTVRAQTAGRTRPWTNDELAALAGNGGQ
jgi:mono/diheme cytochrome c family protein/glucose/arabinose dehydrogenase